MGTVILDTSKTVATEMEIQFLNTWIMFPSLLTQFLEVPFSVLKKGVSQYFCLYSVCIVIGVFGDEFLMSDNFLFESCLIHRGIVMLE